MKVYEAVRWCLSACVVVLAACGGSSEDAPASGGPGGGANPPPTIQSVTVTPATATLEPGQTLIFTAVARDGSGNTVANAVFTWSTSNAAVATINDAGLATGVTAGTVTIGASTGGVSSTAVPLAVIATPTSGATSDELIAQALAAGEISAETALVYRTYAHFSRHLLPVRFRGAIAEIVESPVLEEIRASFATLSPDAQVRLTPFLRRPASVGSWLDPSLPAPAPLVARAATASKRPGTAGPGAVRPMLDRPVCNGTMSEWAYLDSFTVPVRVWYDTREADHGTVAAFVESQIRQQVWPMLISGLSFRQPLDDANGGDCDGGDGRLDIYIVDGNHMVPLGVTEPDVTVTYPANNSANQFPAYILIRANIGGASRTQTIAHEFAHAIHRAYPKAVPMESYGWFRDAFANWAALQVYPQNSPIGDQASCVFDTPERPLDENPEMKCKAVAKPLFRAYGAWLPLESISWKHGAAKIRQILEMTAAADTAFQAMENALSRDGLDAAWKDYALALWNQPPVDGSGSSFKDRHAVEHKPILAQDKSTKVVANLGSQPYDETILDARMNNMAVKFYHFTFSDESARSLMFHNTWNVNKRDLNQKISVQAVYKVEGQSWVTEDWTDYEWIGFCRDLKAQRLEELVIIVASAEFRPNNSTPVVQAAREPKLMRNNIGCWGYEGTITRVYSSNSWATGGVAQTRMDARYAPATVGFPAQFTDRSVYRLRVPAAGPLFAGGTLNYTDIHVESDCRYQANLSVPNETSLLVGGRSVGEIVVNNFLESMHEPVQVAQQELTGADERAYVVNGVTDRVVKGAVTGPQPRCGTEYETAIGAWLLSRATPATSPRVAADGHLRATYNVHVAGDNFRETYSWDLAPRQEP